MMPVSLSPPPPPPTLAPSFYPTLLSHVETYGGGNKGINVGSARGIKATKYSQKYQRLMKASALTEGGRRHWRGVQYLLLQQSCIRKSYLKRLTGSLRNYVVMHTTKTVKGRQGILLANKSYIKIKQKIKSTPIIWSVMQSACSIICSKGRTKITQ